MFPARMWETGSSLTPGPSALRCERTRSPLCCSMQRPGSFSMRISGSGRLRRISWDASPTIRRWTGSWITSTALAKRPGTWTRREGASGCPRRMPSATIRSSETRCTSTSRSTSGSGRISFARWDSSTTTPMTVSLTWDRRSAATGTGTATIRQTAATSICS